jgi:hypothetical protein
MTSKLLKVYQIYYDESQKDSLLTGFTPHFNEKPSVYQESKIMCDLVRGGECLNFDWFGVFSWKVSQKLKGFNYEILKNSISKNPYCDIIGPDYSIRYPPCAKPKHRSLFYHSLFGRDFHDQISHTFNILIQKLQRQGLVPKDCLFLNQELHQIYSNSFVAKTHIYLDYIESLLGPAIDLFQFDEELSELSKRYAGFPLNPPQKWVAHTGLARYPQTPFILERLINLYIYINKNLKIGWLL